MTPFSELNALRDWRDRVPGAIKIQVSALWGWTMIIEIYCLGSLCNGLILSIYMYIYSCMKETYTYIHIYVYIYMCYDRGQAHLHVKPQTGNCHIYIYICIYIYIYGARRVLQKASLSSRTSR